MITGAGGLALSATVSASQRVAAPCATADRPAPDTAEGERDRRARRTEPGPTPTRTDRGTTMTYAFEATGLVKRFGSTVALAGVDLAARQGTVLAVLGPNGAGKTTAVRILATLLRPDEGRATVGGLDVVKDAARVRREIGLTGQYASVDETLTGTENLVLIGRLLDLARGD